MSEKEALFEINVIAGELKNLFTLLQDSHADCHPQVKAVLYFGIDGMNKIEKLSDSEK